MQIQKIIGEHGPQAQLCQSGACPAAIIGDDGNAYIQGYELEAGQRAALSAPAGEGFVRIPLQTLKSIAAQVAQSA